MASRQVLPQRRGAPAAAAAAAAALTYLTLPKTSLHAEAPASSPAMTDRKPIYDSLPAAASPSPSTPSSKPGARSPTDRLAAQVGRARRVLHSGAAAAEDSVNGTLSSALRLERNFTTTVASLAPAPETGERLGPGLVYTLVAGMAASVVTHRRGLLIRGAAPPAVALAAAWTLLPHTMRNVSDLAWEYEKRAPAVADAHLRARAAVETGWKEARRGVSGVGAWTESTVKKGREAVEGWVSKGR